MDWFIDGIGEKLTYMSTIMPAILRGAVISVEIFALTLLISLPLGLPIALGSKSKFFPFKWICKTYIWLFRGTPLMLQLFFFYYFLPNMGIVWDAFLTAVITFSLNYAAYFAEIYRAGIESIDKGQYEAAQSLGVSKWRTMADIIIPQTLKRVLPPISNESITLIKDTALVNVIGVAELLKAAKSAVNTTTDPTAYLLAAIIYLIFTFGLTWLSGYLEKRFSRYEGNA
ncbi:MAG: amino acid ABC transporter permease [Clostridia bacterium]